MIQATETVTGIAKQTNCVIQGLRAMEHDAAVADDVVLSLEGVAEYVTALARTSAECTVPEKGWGGEYAVTADDWALQALVVLKSLKVIMFALHEWAATTPSRKEGML